MMANWHNGRFRAPKSGGASPSVLLFPVIILSGIIGLAIEYPLLLALLVIALLIFGVAVVIELKKERIDKK